LDGEKYRQKLKHLSPLSPPFSQTQTHSFLPDSSAFFPYEQWRGMCNGSVFLTDMADISSFAAPHTCPLLLHGLSVGSSSFREYSSAPV